MKEYDKLPLRVSSNPHIRGPEDTRSLMLDVIIALLPSIAMAVYVFGWRALSATLVSAASCVGFEALWCFLRHKRQTVGDLSAVVTGMMLAMGCSSLMPYWMLIVGAFFAIVVVKELYGGLGKNFLNPALAGRAALVACYASHMSTWAKPFERAGIFSNTADVVTAATPMAILKSNGLEALQSQYTLSDMLLGFCGGSIGGVSSLMLLLGGFYLLFRRVITWHIPVSYLATVALLSYLFPMSGDAFVYMLYSILGGSLLLGAFFMATDYTTSPVTGEGRIIFGVGCGLLTVFIRYFGAYSEGVGYAVLVMNCFTGLIDKHCKPLRFGTKGKREEATGK